MKWIYLSILLLALSCDIPKKESTIVETETNETAPTPEVSEPKKEVKQNFIVVLRNTKQKNKAKDFIINAGLQWKNIDLEEDVNATMAYIDIPDERYDFWKEKLESSNEFSAVKINEDKILDELIAKEKNKLISISKTSCFGDCPVYELLIDKTGKVTYNGKQYVLSKGVSEFTLTDEELEILNNKLINTSFSSYKDVYDNPKIMDLPSTFITHQGKQVQIRLWNDDVPAELMDLHEYIEGILLEKKFFE
ncbi:DUF6438 domain-containing protein [Tenacibaculum agarivorans]|uniref:DUF6438 domain-containing protein n=1 Tax=Tenacibaculum agarivorans TaxID=1908389 RepID=UPI00094BB9C1|nr:DUF6438 domain-containing protein [Tenacibaculum agarivorans]